MSTLFDEIVKKIDLRIIDNSRDGGKWGPVPDMDPTVPVYILNPPGDTSAFSGVDSLIKFGRYGNWVGGGFGGARFSPGFPFAKFEDLEKAGGLAALEAEILRYTNKYGIAGEYWEDPTIRPRDAVDAFGRVHDLLYQDADNAAADRYLTAAKLWAVNGDDEALAIAYEEALAISRAGRREADVWWLAKTKDVVGDHPYGIALKNIGDIVFGLEADYYYLQNLDVPPVDVILRELGGIYGSRLGLLIAGDDPFTPVLASALGRELGEGLADFLSGKNSLDLGDSLLELFEGGLPLIDLFEGALKEFGIDADNAGLSVLSKIATTLIGDAAEALGLEGLEEYVFTEAGEALADYLTRILSTGDIDNLTDFVTRIGNDLDFSDIANFLIDLALDYVTNDFVSDLLADVRGIVDVDSAAEAIVAEISSVIGSIIGSIELPWFGGQIGSAIGYILGSIQFEVLNFLSFGLFEDFINLFIDDPEPQSMFYVGLDPDTGLLEVIGRDYKRDGIETEQILNLHEGNKQLNDAYMAFVNGIIESIGGTADGSFFYPIDPWLGVEDPNVDYLNHGMIGFDTDKFYTDVYWGGNRDRIRSNDPQTIISNAIAFELAHLNFYGGDLAQIRALHQWEGSLFSQLLTPALPLELADIFDGVSVPSRPLDPKLGLLAANMQIAKDYRFYLDNIETINYLMMQAPQSSFALGWIATLTRAAELGLNAPYIGSPHGGAGTAAAETILSADGNDLLFGNGGDDLIKTYGGDDVAYGGEGNDDIQGGSGRDILLGDSGDDRLRGGTDDDSLFGYQGNDNLAGDGGDDEIAGEEGDDALDGGLGDDVLFGDIPGAAGRDTLTGGDGDDLARGGAGDDRIAGDSGADRLYGDEGADEVEGGEGNDRIEGGAGSDRLDGGAGVDRILGDDGDDVIAGGSGDDLLYGLAGTDTIAGGGGRDLLFGDEGNDLIDGGGDDDEGGGWKGDDRLEGGGGNDRLAGQDGSDVVLGGDGDDILYGDRAPDSGPLAHTEAEIIDSARARLGAGDFTIIYQGPDYSYDALRAADHDLIVINPAKSAITGAYNSEQLWSAGEVDGIEAGGKILLAYLNVAKINDFANYWNPAWTTGGGADDPLASGAPDFLGGEDAGFDHTRLIDFWEDGWRDLLVERIATIVEQGFSGIFLDDVLEYFIRRGDTVEEIAQAARDMRDLVIELAAAARTLVAAHSGAAAAEGFLIVVNGAPFLIQDTTADGSAADSAADAAFYASLDGFLAENYFSQGLGYAIDEAVAEFGARGIALLSVDTDIVTEEQRIGIERAAVNAGFLPEVVPDALFASATARFRVGFGDVAAPGDDILDGGPGNDMLFGGAGSDTARYAGAGAGVTVTLRRPGEMQDTGGAGFDALLEIEHLTGSAFADTLIGNDYSNIFDGLGGADMLRGGWGDDVYFVDDSGDVVDELAGQGIDTVFTSLAVYSLVGTQIERLGAASDIAHDFRGNAGDNAIIGGAGSDLLRLYDGGIDNVNAGAGNDIIFFIGALTAADVVDGGAGLDTLVLQGPYGSLALSANVTRIENVSILGGNNTSFGEPGTNRYDYVLTTNDANFAAGVQARINGAALLEGEDFTFDGSAETDAKYVVYGGKGKDTLTGGLGNDIFFYAEERFASGDVVNGGAGYDGMFLRGNYTIDFTAPGYTGLFTSIENLTLTSATDERYARGGGTEFDYNLILSNAIVKPGEQLTISGTLLMASETMILDASQELDGLLRLFGGRAGDTLKGGGQADLLYGGMGADILAGNGGADAFRYQAIEESNAANMDQILDFTAGTDKIELDRIDANTLVGGDQGFSWIGSNAFSGQAGQLRAYQQGGTWFVEGDVNGDSVADLVITLTLQGPTPLSAGDFLL